MKHLFTINDMDPNFHNPPGAELRQAYEAVERAEHLLAETRKLSVSGSYLRDTLASGYWSPHVFRIFGLDRAEEAPPIDVWISMVLRPDFERTAEACASPKLDSPVFSTTSLVLLPTTIFQIKIHT